MDTGSADIFLHRTSGYSMWPFLRQGQQVLIKSCAAADLRRGDIVAYRLGSTLVCHRFLGRSRRAGTGVMVVRGDCSFDGPEHISAESVVGRVAACIHGPDNVSCEGTWYRVKASVIVCIAPLIAFCVKMFKPAYRYFLKNDRERS